MAQNGPTEDQKKLNSGLLVELNKFISIRDYRQVLKVTNKLLHTDGFRQNDKLSKCKVVALLKMAKYDEVVKFANQSTEKYPLDTILAYEKAYALYRLFQDSAALEALQKSVINSVDEQLKVDELRAQILYRLEKFEDARDIYKNLLRNCLDDVEEDRQTNILACEASISMRRNYTDKVKMIKVSAASPDSFINRGIIYLNNNELKRSEKCFTQAKVDTESYDDLEADELEQELAPIQAQLGLVYQLSGEKDKAMELYQKVLKSYNPSMILSAVVNNNILALNQTNNLFDSKKKVKALQTKTDTFIKKFQSSQLLTMEVNKALVAYASGQVNAALDIIKDIHKNRGGHILDAVLIEAACLAKLGNIPKAIGLLQTTMSTTAGATEMDQLNLSLAQLSFKDANLEKYADSPAFLALKLAVARQDPTARLSFMKQAADTWTRSEKRTNLLKLYGEELLSSNSIGHQKQACDVFEELSRIDESYLPRFIQVAGQVDPEKARQASSRLPDTVSLIKDVNIEELEKSAGIAGSRYAKKKEGTQDKKEDEKAMKKRRKRKPRLPKVMHKHIDPERWEPLRDRSYFRGKKWKKKFGGDQGMVGDSKMTDRFDASKDAYQKPVSSSQQTSSTKRRPKGNKKGRKR